jgi:hypothetical protein
VSHIPNFEGESPVPVVPISVWASSANSVGASSEGPSAGAPKTRAGKHKAKVVAAPPPPKARKVGARKPQVSKSMSLHREHLQP